MGLTKEGEVVAIRFERSGALAISRNAPQGPRNFTRPPAPT